MLLKWAPGGEWDSAFLTSSNAAGPGTTEALRDKDKYSGCSAEGVDSLGWGDQRRHHGGKHCRAPQETGGIWRGRGGRRGVAAAWAGPEGNVMLRAGAAGAEGKYNCEERAGKAGWEQPTKGSERGLQDLASIPKGVKSDMT